MRGTAVMTMLLTGLCFLPSCSPRRYILVTTLKTWDEAQMYCRWKYTDLASVHNQQDLAELNQLIAELHSIWIGLRADSGSWRWSLENQTYYGDGEAGFRKWIAGEPNDGGRTYKYCVSVQAGGMADDQCASRMKFICYNGTAGTNETSSSYIFITEPKTWEEARSYCRTHYIDLTSVRNQAENDLIQTVTSGEWIGLYRDSWKWSDGSKHSFSYWISGAPSTTYTDSCAYSFFGKWSNQHCQNSLYFVCYIEEKPPKVWKQVVRVVLKKTDSTVDMEELKDGILEEFSQRLEEHGLGQDVKLRWATQPDGKVFHKKKEEKSCC